MFDTVVDTEHYWHDSTGGFLQMMSALGGVFKDMVRHKAQQYW